MSTAARVQGSFQTITSRYTAVAGIFRKVASHYVFRSGAWRQIDAFVPAFSASADQTDVSGFSFSSKPNAQTVRSSYVTVTPSGGSGPYSYTWTRADGDNRITAGSPTSASTNFSANLNNEEASADFVWAVTDAYGSTANGSVSVDLVQSNGISS